jgi:hypothetical protein
VKGRRVGPLARAGLQAGPKPPKNQVLSEHFVSVGTGAPRRMRDVALEDHFVAFGLFRATPLSVRISFVLLLLKLVLSASLVHASRHEESG